MSQSSFPPPKPKGKGKLRDEGRRGRRDRVDSWSPSDHESSQSGSRDSSMETARSKSGSRGSEKRKETKQTVLTKAAVDSLQKLQGETDALKQKLNDKKNGDVEDKEPVNLDINEETLRRGIHWTIAPNVKNTMPVWVRALYWSMKIPMAASLLNFGLSWWNYMTGALRTQDEHGVDIGVYNAAVVDAKEYVSAQQIGYQYGSVVFLDPQQEPEEDRPDDMNKKKVEFAADQREVLYTIKNQFGETHRQFTISMGLLSNIYVPSTFSLGDDPKDVWNRFVARARSLHTVNQSRSQVLESIWEDTKTVALALFLHHSEQARNQSFTGGPGPKARWSNMGTGSETLPYQISGRSSRMASLESSMTAILLIAVLLLLVSVATAIGFAVLFLTWVGMIISWAAYSSVFFATGLALIAIAIHALWLS